MPESTLVEHIRSHYSDFSKSERYVADYVCNHLTQVIRMSISELKDAAGVSLPTVHRFCKTLGFNGYKEFRISLAEQAPTFSDYFTIESTENESRTHALVRQLLLSERDAIEATLSLLNFDILEQAAQKALNAKRICLFGVSTSYDVCRDLQRKLSRLGLNVWSYNEIHDATVQLTAFSSEDLLICISQSGATKETVGIAKSFYDTAVPVLSITAFKDSPLAQSSDLVLLTHAPEVTNNRLGLTTRMAQFAYGDALYMAIASNIDHDVGRMMEQTLFPLLKHK
ncbi:MAG: MurR/RpiR family transcriptional regulator [Clostridia bacterium]|nr:MurR/RpiR family transcriptional regulator [Clostridia bacterium]